MRTEAAGVPFATWDGALYVVRVDLEPWHASGIADALRADGMPEEAQAFMDAAKRVAALRAGVIDDE